MDRDVIGFVMILYLLLACTSTNERGIISSSSKRMGARLEISVTPPDALIHVDGLPWNGARLSKGVHQLSIEKEGFHSSEQLLSISDLSILRLEVQLKRDDVPLHFYYPIEKKLHLIYGEKNIEFFGSATLDVPLGALTIKTEDDVVLFRGKIHEETHIHRCPKPKGQRTDCIGELILGSAPLDFDFCDSSLWLSTHSPQKALFAYDLRMGTLTHHMLLDSSARIQCQDEKLFLLYDNGEFYSYQPKTKTKTQEHIFDHSWVTGFLKQGKDVYLSSWFHDKVVFWDGTTEHRYPITKPKYMFTLQEDVLILGSEPGAVYRFDGTQLRSIPNSNPVQGSIDEANQALWILDESSNSIKRVSLVSQEIKTMLELEQGDIKDLIVTNNLVIVLIHLTESGFSLGRGTVQIFDKETMSLHDEIPTVPAPLKMILSKDDILAVGDISTMRVQLFDVSPLRKK